MTKDGAPQSGATVSFTASSDTPSTAGATLGANACVTGAEGKCSVELGKSDYGVVTVLAATPGDSTPASSSHSVTFKGPWSITIGDGTNTNAVATNGSVVSVTVNGTITTRPVSMVSSLVIAGGGGNDSLTVGAMDVAVSFDGGAGNNTLHLGGGAVVSLNATGGSVSSAGTAGATFSNVSSISASGTGNTLAGPTPDTSWTLTGPNAGSVGALSFSGFDNLTGSAGNKDTFVVSGGGALSGRIDGGAGGFDTLVINGGHSSVSSTANNATSGTITLDGTTIAYTGLEPITIVPAPAPVIPVAAVTINGSSGGDHITIQNDGSTGNLIATAPTMESISFPVPTSTLTIDGGDGDDEVTLAGTLSLPGVAFLVKAEKISVSAGAVVTATGGSITLQAANNQTGSALSGLVNATGSASATVTDAHLTSGNIVISATSTVAPPSPSSKFIGLHADSTATVSVDGASEISASGSVSLTASSTVTAPMSAVASPGDGTPGADAAVAGSLISSTATATVSGSTSVTATGDVSVSATNVVAAMASGDASAAAGGAGIALANVTQRTSASIGGSASITAANLTVLADSDGSVTSTSRASRGGSSGNDESPASRTASGPTDTTGNAHTAEGELQYAGALSFSRLDSATEAYVGGTTGTVHVTTTGGKQTVNARSKAHSSAEADGGPVDSSASGVGVAIAVNLATVATTARLGDTVLGANAVVVRAEAPEAMTFGASAISGAGSATNVGFAGALSVSVVGVNTSASVDAGKTVSAPNADLRFAASSSLDSTASSGAAADATTGAKTGIGASVAVHIVDDHTRAVLEDGSNVTAHDLTLEATSNRSVATSAQGGAAGGTAVTPVVAITYSGFSTEASVGTGVTLDISGNLVARATDTSAPVTTSAEGDALGTNTSVGAALALGIADHSVTATTRSSFSTPGSVEFGASGSSGTATEAKASANGAAAEGSGTPDVNHQVASQRSFGSGVRAANGGGGDSAPATPPANSSSGAISVAAAVSVNIAKTSSSSSLPAGVSVSAGSLSFWSSASTDAKANADGSATTARGPPSGTTIGAAVAINYATVTNSATVAGTANGPATVRALVTSAGDGRHDFGATATSGAGGGKVGFAGSLAINIVHLDTHATVTGTVAAGSGSVELGAASNARSIAKALPANGGVSGASKLGIGASVALNLVDDTTTATVADGATITGHDLTLRASAAHDMSTDAQTGASGGGVSIAPAVAIALSNITTTATIGTGAPMTIAGALAATADQTASAHTNASGDTEGSSASIGFALALTIANHLAEANLGRDLTAGGAVTFAAHGSSDSSASATASAAGAPGDASGGGAGTGVDQTVQTERSFASATDSSTGGSGASGADATPHAATSAGGISVAAAIAINLAKTSSLATIGAVTVMAGGRFTLSTSADTDAHAIADGTAVRNAADSSAPADSTGGAGAPADSTTGVSIGAGVAIDYARIRNEAILPTGATVTSNGATLEARMASAHELGAAATSGASGGSFSIAGSVAIDIENIETTASLAGTLNAGTGTVLIFAARVAASTTSARSRGTTRSSTRRRSGAVFTRRRTAARTGRSSRVTCRSRRGT